MKYLEKGLCVKSQCKFSNFSGKLYDTPWFMKLELVWINFTNCGKVKYSESAFKVIYTHCDLLVCGTGDIGISG